MLEHHYSAHHFKKKKLSKPIRLIILGGVPLLTVYSMKLFIVNEPSLIDTIIGFVLGLGLAFGVCSFIRSPKQFFVAITERIRWVQGHLLAGFYTIVNLVRALSSLFLKAFFWMIVVIAYVLSPIDLIPDVLFPVGFLDDIGLVFLVIRFTNIVLSQELKAKAREAIAASKIETPFP